ncbi:MAG TPA: methylated-DNA--[protein]-cysteine S-methyltransferase [Wenzhouxiangella sp.]
MSTKTTPAEFFGSLDTAPWAAAPIGVLTWRVTELGLHQLWFGAQAVSVTQCPHPLVDQIKEQLVAYLAGELKEFDVPLARQGTPFQRRCWDALQTIGYGQTLSYGEQAQLIGQPSATRAVANANGANPIPIIIPCHRVIASDGGLGGYGPGVDKKQWLLTHELTHD